MKFVKNLITLATIFCFLSSDSSFCMIREYLNRGKENLPTTKQCEQELAYHRYENREEEARGLTKKEHIRIINCIFENPGNDTNFVENIFRGNIEEVRSNLTENRSQTIRIRVPISGLESLHYDFRKITNTMQESVSANKRDLIDYLISLSTNAKVKEFVIGCFFSGRESQKKLDLQFKEALSKLNALLNPDDQISDNPISMQEFSIFEKYMISKIKIDRIKNKVYLIKLPCLQQIGGTCSIHAFVNSKIFAQNDLELIIAKLNSSEDDIQRAKKRLKVSRGISHDQDLLGGYTRIEISRLLIKLFTFFEDYYDRKKMFRFIRRFKTIDDNSVINYIGACDQKFIGVTFSNTGSHPKKNHEIVCYPKETFLIEHNYEEQAGHYLSAKVQKNRRGDLLIFYADSENIVNNFYDKKLFLSLASNFGY